MTQKTAPAIATQLFWNSVIVTPFVRLQEYENNKKHFVPCATFNYPELDTTRTFVIGGPYDREIDAYESAIQVVCALFYIFDPSGPDTSLPEITRLTLAEHIPPESQQVQRVKSR